MPAAFCAWAVRAVIAAPNRSSAKTKVTKPSISSMSWAQWNRTRWVAWGWRIVTMPTMPATARNRTSTPNIQRQPIAASPTPPTVGPSAGAIAQTMLPTPISRPRRDRGDCSRMILNIRGSATPVPAPCRMRAIMSMGKFTASAASSKPAMHSTTAAMNDVFRVKRWLRYGDSGVTIETTSR